MCNCLYVFVKQSRHESKDIIIFNDSAKSYGECSICLEDMVNNIEALPCGHLFHVKCIRLWLKQQQVCPICAFAL